MEKTWKNMRKTWKNMEKIEKIEKIEQKWTKIEQNWTKMNKIEKREWKDTMNVCFFVIDWKFYYSKY